MTGCGQVRFRRRRSEALALPPLRLNTGRSNRGPCRRRPGCRIRHRFHTRPCRSIPQRSRSLGSRTSCRRRSPWSPSSSTRRSRYWTRCIPGLRPRCSPADVGPRRRRPSLPSIHDQRSTGRFRGVDARAVRRGRQRHATVLLSSAWQAPVPSGCRPQHVSGDEEAQSELLVQVLPHSMKPFASVTHFWPDSQQRERHALLQHAPPMQVWPLVQQVEPHATPQTGPPSADPPPSAEPLVDFPGEPHAHNAAAISMPADLVTGPLEIFVSVALASSVTRMIGACHVRGRAPGTCPMEIWCSGVAWLQVPSFAECVSTDDMPSEADRRARQPSYQGRGDSG